MSLSTIREKAAKSSPKEFVIWYLRQPFVMIVWFMETFAKNRDRMKNLMARDGAASVLKTLVIATFLVWLGVFAFLANEESGDRLSCAVMDLLNQGGLIDEKPAGTGGSGQACF